MLRIACRRSTRPHFHSSRKYACTHPSTQSHAQSQTALRHANPRTTQIRFFAEDSRRFSGSFRHRQNTMDEASLYSNDRNDPLVGAHVPPDGEPPNPFNPEALHLTEAEWNDKAGRRRSEFDKKWEEFKTKRAQLTYEDKKLVSEQLHPQQLDPKYRYQVFPRGDHSFKPHEADVNEIPFPLPRKVVYDSRHPYYDRQEERVDESLRSAAADEDAKRRETRNKEGVTNVREEEYYRQHGEPDIRESFTKHAFSSSNEIADRRERERQLRIDPLRIDFNDEKMKNKINELEKINSKSKNKSSSEDELKRILHNVNIPRKSNFTTNGLPSEGWYGPKSFFPTHGPHFIQTPAPRDVTTPWPRIPVVRDYPLPVDKIYLKEQKHLTNSQILAGQDKVIVDTDWLDRMSAFREVSNANANANANAKNANANANANGVAEDSSKTKTQVQAQAREGRVSGEGNNKKKRNYEDEGRGGEGGEGSDAQLRAEKEIDLLDDDGNKIIAAEGEESSASLKTASATSSSSSSSSSSPVEVATNFLSNLRPGEHIFDRIGREYHDIISQVSDGYNDRGNSRDSALASASDKLDKMSDAIDAPDTISDHLAYANLISDLKLGSVPFHRLLAKEPFRTFRADPSIVDNSSDALPSNRPWHPDENRPMTDDEADVLWNEAVGMPFPRSMRTVDANTSSMEDRLAFEKGFEETEEEQDSLFERMFKNLEAKERKGLLEKYRPAFIAAQDMPARIPALKRLYRSQLILQGVTEDEIEAFLTSAQERAKHGDNSFVYPNIPLRNLDERAKHARALLDKSPSRLTALERAAHSSSPTLHTPSLEDARDELRKRMNEAPSTDGNKERRGRNYFRDTAPRAGSQGSDKNQAAVDALSSEAGDKARAGAGEGGVSDDVSDEDVIKRDRDARRARDEEYNERENSGRQVTDNPDVLALAEDPATSPHFIHGLSNFYPTVAERARDSSELDANLRSTFGNRAIDNNRPAHPDADWDGYYDDGPGSSQPDTPERSSEENSSRSGRGSGSGSGSQGQSSTSPLTPTEQFAHQEFVWNHVESISPFQRLIHLRRLRATARFIKDTKAEARRKYENSYRDLQHYKERALVGELTDDESRAKYGAVNPALTAFMRRTYNKVIDLVQDNGWSQAQKERCIAQCWGVMRNLHMTQVQWDTHKKEAETSIAKARMKYAAKR